MNMQWDAINGMVALTRHTNAWLTIEEAEQQVVNLRAAIDSARSSGKKQPLKLDQYASTNRVWVRETNIEIGKVCISTHDGVEGRRLAESVLTIAEAERFAEKVLDCTRSIRARDNVSTDADELRE